MNFREKVLIVCQVTISEVLKVCPQEEKQRVSLEDLIYVPQVSFTNERLRVGAHTNIFMQVHVHIPLMDIVMRRRISLFGSINLKMPENKIFQSSSSYSSCSTKNI